MALTSVSDMLREELTRRRGKGAKEEREREREGAL